MTDVEIPMKSFVSGFIGITFAGIFMIMTWIDTWIFFSLIILGALLVVNQNYTLFPVGLAGMLSVGVFTKIGWMDPILFFSAFIVSALILAQQIVSRQFDIGHGSSGQGGK